MRSRIVCSVILICMAIAGVALLLTGNMSLGMALVAASSLTTSLVIMRNNAKAKENE